MEVQSFYESSTIHGIKYLSNRYYLIERMFWLISLILSLIATVYLMTELIINAKSIPVIVVISDKQVNVSEIDFPALSICSGLNPFHLHDFHGYRSEYYDRFTQMSMQYDDFEFTQDEQTKFFNISYSDLLEKIDSNQMNLNDMSMPMLKRLQVVDLISRRGTFARKNFTVPTADFLDVINEFHKEGKQENPSYITLNNVNNAMNTETISEYGLCITFNLAKPEDLIHLNLTSADFNHEYFINERDRKNNSIYNTVPHRENSADSVLEIGSFADEGMIKNEGFMFDMQMLIIHDSYELPTKYSQEIPIKINKLAIVWLEPQIRTLDDSLFDEDLESRNCYHENEYLLKLFKVYTKTNCESECLTDFMIDQCGCVEYFMIRNKTARICSSSEKMCFDKARSNFEYQLKKCKCLNPCNYVKIVADIEQTSQSLLNDMMPYWMRFTMIKVKYRTNDIKNFVRKRNFDAMNFLSFVGGLLGLFAGFSVLSMVELLFWFIFKILLRCCNRMTSVVHPMNEKRQELGEKFKLFREFFEKSSVHGLNYMNSKKFAEKLFWTLFITLSITVCIQMTVNVPGNVRVIAYDDAMAFNEKIQFPAVTLIPGFYWSKNYSNDKVNEHYHILKEKLLKEAFPDPVKREKAMRFLWYETGLYGVESYAEIFGKVFDLRPYYFDLHRIISNPDWFRQQIATWNQKYQVNFTELRTHNMYGYTFNSMDLDKLLNFSTVNDEFKSSRNITMIRQSSLLTIPEECYPLSVNINDHSTFQLRLKLPKHENSNLSTSANTLIAIHAPDFLSTFFTLGPNNIQLEHSTIIEVTPEITRSDQTLRTTTPIDRGCYFEDEHKLKYFKIYSQKYCEMECIMDHILNFCGCQMYNFIYGHNRSANICYFDGSLCVEDAKKIFFTENNIRLEDNCTCLPLCNSLTYHIKHHEIENQDDRDIVISIYMKTEDVIVYRRFQQFTISDGVSYVGGLLGLFAGISILSIVEFVYFFTGRVLVDVVRSMKVRRLQ